MLIRDKLTKFNLFVGTVTIIKIVLMILFTSDYEQKLFLPFINSFIENFDVNPYDYFYQKHGFIAFPYPCVMLGIMSLGFFMTTLLGNWALRIPLLIMDYLGLIFLMKLFPNNRKFVGLLYWASPIIIYSTYMHGQLDIVPTSFFLGAIYYLFNRSTYSEIKFAICFSLAVLSKLHILASLPLIIIYLYKKKDWKRVLYLICSLVIGYLIVLLPCSSEIFWNSILLNKEQSLLTKVYISFIDLKMYLPIFALMIVYLLSYSLGDINKELLISFLGLLFSVFIVLLPPMPGWYLWIIPFITAFFIVVTKNRKSNIYIYILLNLLYLVYFLTAHRSEYVDLYFLGNDMSFLKIKYDLYINLCFTLLTGLLMYIIYELYIYGITSNNFYRRKGKPLSIGIAGDSGTGKSTMLEIVYNCLGKHNTLQIEGDGDHRWERNYPMWEKYTHLNPKANYLYRQAMDIIKLKRGETIKRVEYDHTTGKFSEPHNVYPNKYIVLSSLHAFYLPQLRKVTDLKLYMDTDETLRRYWKVSRDTHERGYSFEKILKQIDARRSDTEKYIMPQKQFADLVICYFDNTLKDCCDLKHKVILSLKLTMSLSINIEPFVEILEKEGIVVNNDFSPDLQKQIIIIDGDSMIKHEINFQKIAEKLIPHIDELTTESLATKNTLNGIIQTVLLLVLSQKMKFDQEI